MTSSPETQVFLQGMHFCAYYCTFMPTSSSFFPEERHQLILERLAQGGRIVALDLARELGTSEDTIRRDLRELAKAGLCQRIYGGALSLSPALGTFAERQGLLPERKAALGQTAASLVKPGQFIFLDAGTTNLEIARALPANAKIKVATNAPAIALAATAKLGADVLLIGGIMDAHTSAALGARAIRDVQTLSIDLCFLGLCAVSKEGGLRGFNFEDVELKRVLVEQSNVVAATVTADKLETAAPFQIATFNDIDHLVVENDVDPELIKTLKSMGLSVHQTAAD
jgi:DeoR/GlpR family transcriptional regulator of sugar metabolism